jgi:succinylglutamic semialdehyde dehydrogenase
MNTNKSHFINGQWTEGKGLQFLAYNPATGIETWAGNEAAADEVQAAVTAAKTAFPAWSNLSVEERIGYLESFRNFLNQSKDALAEAISMEVGKPLWESKAEVAAMIGKIALSIEAYGVRCPEMIKPQAKGMSITRHRPHGVMAVFGPFNFPGHLPNGHIIPALLAGNTIVFKPSELTPLIAEFTTECWAASGLPEGVFNLVQGGRETGKLLAESAIDGLLFTGSWRTGSVLAELFAPAPEKILALEMGGNNPYVVSNVEELKTAAYLTIQSAFLTSGQRCTCARRLIVPKGEKGDSFLEELVAMSQQIRIGAYTDVPEPFMGPVISEQAAEHLINKQNQWLTAGAGSLLLLSRSTQGNTFVTPGIIDVTSVANRPDEEVFGPLLQVIRVPDFTAAIEEANRTKYGLAAGLLSDSKEEYRLFNSQVRAGVINWNTPLTGASSAAPFGGIGQSGNFRPSAFYAADYCAYPIASLEKEKIEMPETISPGIGSL